MTSSISFTFWRMISRIAFAGFAQRKRDILLDRHGIEERAALEQGCRLCAGWQRAGARSVR